MKYFESSEKKGYTWKDLQSVVSENRSRWKFSRKISVDKFIEQLQKMQLIKSVELSCPLYGHSHIRYVSGAGLPIFQLGHTLKNRAYYSHKTALYLHGLADQKSQTLYVNVEQSVKPRGKSSLNQSNIDRAFQSRGRKSKYIFECEDWQICILNGKNTGNLGAETMSTPHGNLPVTNLERTLIDIVVRPAYSGGCQEVLNAYQKAKDKISVDRLIGMLKKIRYVYPYHQAIGFYMNRAGFDEASLMRLKQLGMKYDFYLDYNMKKKEFSKEWCCFPN